MQSAVQALVIAGRDASGAQVLPRAAVALEMGQELLHRHYDASFAGHMREITASGAGACPRAS